MTRWPRILGLTPGELTWLVVGILLLGYELWAIATRDGDVLTRAMRANTSRWLVWPVGIGILMGHLFGPTMPAPRWLPIVWGVALAAVVARDLIVRTPIPTIATFGIFLVSVMLGATTWIGRP